MSKETHHSLILMSVVMSTDISSRKVLSDGFEDQRGVCYIDGRRWRGQGGVRENVVGIVAWGTTLGGLAGSLKGDDSSGAPLLMGLEDPQGRRLLWMGQARRGGWCPECRWHPLMRDGECSRRRRLRALGAGGAGRDEQLALAANGVEAAGRRRRGGRAAVGKGARRAP